MERRFFFMKKKQICSLKVNELQLARNACLNLGTQHKQMPAPKVLGTRHKQMPKDVKNVQKLRMDRGVRLELSSWLLHHG